MKTDKEEEEEEVEVIMLLEVVEMNMIDLNFNLEIMQKILRNK